MDNNITKFLKDRHILTLATCVDNTPYCSNMFYAWMESEAMFVFSTSLETKHVADVEINSTVGGSVVLDTKVVGKIRGIQFTGEMFKPEGELLGRAKERYLKRFPFAAIMDLDFWVIRVTFIKMTDNRFGFGKKIVWKIQEK